MGTYFPDPTRFEPFINFVVVNQNKIFLRFGVAGLKVVTKGIIFMAVSSLFCKAVLRIENFISAKISSAKLLG